MVSKLLFLENGSWKLRRFTHAVECLPDGRISVPQRVSGHTLILATGVGARKRPLMVLREERARVGSFEAVVKMTEIGLGLGFAMRGLMVLAAR